MEERSTMIQNAQQQQQQKLEYTFIISGMNYGPNANLLQEASVDSIVLVFDAVPNHTYSRTVEKTSFATEDRVTFSDHAVIKDDVISFTAFVNSSPTLIRKGNKLDDDTDKNNPVASRRPQKALDLLNRCINERALIKVATEDGLFDDFIITKLTAKRDVGEGAALVFDIEMTQFRIFTIGKVVNAEITSDPKKSPTKNKGAVQSSTKGDDKFKKEPTALAPEKETPDGKGPDKHQSYVIRREKLPNSTKEVVKGDNKQSDIPN